MKPSCGSGTAQYRPQMALLIILCNFQYASRNNYFSDIRFFPQPLITITIARCPANFINLSAIIVDLWLSILSRLYSCTTTRPPSSPTPTVAPRSLPGLTFPDFDLAPKRNEKFGYCGLDLV